MRYYKDRDGQVFAYDTEQERERFGADGLVTMSADEVNTHFNPPPTPDARRAGVAAERYKHETAGIMLNGMQIDTGRDSQSLITGATVQAMLDPRYVLRWKTVNGFVELTAEQVISMASTVRAHVQACFDRESELLDALADGTFTPAMMDDGWPA